MINRQKVPPPLRALFPWAILLASPLCAAPQPPAPTPGYGVSMAGASTSTLPDPKYPGKPLYIIHAVSSSGQSEQNGFLVSLTGVSAQLFQQGRPSATLTAPRARADSVKKSVVVTGTGGVVMKSLTQPGTKLTADMIVWYATLNKIVATGHVFYRDGKTGGVWTGPQLIADTRLKNIHTGPGHIAVSL